MRTPHSRLPLHAVALGLALVIIGCREDETPRVAFKLRPNETPPGVPSEAQSWKIENVDARLFDASDPGEIKEWSLPIPGRGYQRVRARCTACSADTTEWRAASAEVDIRVVQRGGLIFGTAVAGGSRFSVRADTNQATAVLSVVKAPPAGPSDDGCDTCDVPNNGGLQTLPTAVGQPVEILVAYDKAITDDALLALQTIETNIPCFEKYASVDVTLKPFPLENTPVKKDAHAALSALRKDSGLAAARRQRCRARADMVVLLIPGAEGKACVNANADTAMSVVGVNDGTNSMLFWHEFGHVLGANHQGEAFNHFKKCPYYDHGFAAETIDLTAPDKKLQTIMWANLGSVLLFSNKECCGTLDNRSVVQKRAAEVAAFSNRLPDLRDCETLP